MPKLSDVAYAILADLTLAQDRANALTRVIAPKYQSDPILQYLPVPNADLDEVELTLHFAVAEGALPQETAKVPAAPPSERWVRALAAEVVRRVTRAFTRTLQGHPVEAKLEPQRQRILGSLGSPDVHRELANHVVPVLEQALASPPSGPERPAWCAQVAARAAESIRGALAGDEALRSFLIAARLPLAGVAPVEAAAGADRVISREVIEELARVLQGALERLAGAAGDEQPIPDLDVLIDAQTLAGLPEQAVQSIRLKARIRDYKWVVTATGSLELVAEDR